VSNYIKDGKAKSIASIECTYPMATHKAKHAKRQ